MHLSTASLSPFPVGLALPWETPLRDWEHPGLVRLTRGLSRNVVRFVGYRDTVYAVKEFAERLAEREYTMLRGLVELGLPAVEPICLVTGRQGEGVRDRGLLVTRYLDHSLPLRTLISGGASADQARKLLDALADLLVRLHLGGFFWGDCSLSNTLFRLDAGRYAAYLVDAETAELHAWLPDGQRRHDLAIAAENLAGGLMDVEAGFGLPAGIEPVDLAARLEPRYEQLWADLNRLEEYPIDRVDLIEARVRHLNELGFDVKELEFETVPDAASWRVRARPKESGYHRRLVRQLTGLDVQENQARRLLNDLYAYRALQTGLAGKDIPVTVSAQRWLNEVYYPTLESVPTEERSKLDDAEIFHQLLEHRWYMSEREGHVLGLKEVVPSYVATILAPLPIPRVQTDLLADGG